MYGGRGREGEQGSLGGGRETTNQRQREARERAVERRRRLAAGALSLPLLSSLSRTTNRVRGVVLQSIGRDPNGRGVALAWATSGRWVAAGLQNSQVKFGIRLIFYLNFKILNDFYQI
jgi:hypothetical protein